MRLRRLGETGKTHSSSIEADQPEKVREYFKNGSRTSGGSRPVAEAKPKFDLTKVSKPGDALKAILERQAGGGGSAVDASAATAAAGGGDTFGGTCGGTWFNDPSGSQARYNSGGDDGSGE